MEPLKRLQVDGYLMFAEPNEIFSNLDELCYVRIVTLTAVYVHISFEAGSVSLIVSFEVF